VTLIRWLLSVALLALVAACGGGSDDSAPSATATGTATIVEFDVAWPTAGWEQSSPEAEGMSSAALAALNGVCDEYGCQAVVVTRHGRIVWEYYGEGQTADTTYIGYSTAKSVTSALIGIAIEEGLIESVDQPVSDFVEEWRGGDKAGITLRHLMSLTSGLQWAEGYTGSNDVTSMVASEDHVRYVLERPVAAPPGERFLYSTGDPAVLSRVLEVATGMDAAAYAQEKIFSEIGMERAAWPSDRAGQTLTYCCVITTAREFAKFGYLYLRNGEWDGQQLVPEAWVRETTQPSQQMFPQYGLLWWVPDLPGAPDDTFMARGIQARHVYVIPSLDIVAVRIGTADQAGDADLNAFITPIVEAVMDE
jgi:CubicO group peptidase (beta-lactamase class C family)